MSDPIPNTAPAVDILRLLSSVLGLVEKDGAPDLRDAAQAERERIERRLSRATAPLLNLNPEGEL